MDNGIRKVNGLTLYSTKEMSRTEWLNKRQDGVGGSDISSILGLNHRFPCIELFYQKVGMTFDASESTNSAMFWGTQLEDFVLNIGQYLDINSGEYLDNFASGNMLRKISKVPYMVQNPKYPHILANLDGASGFRPRSFKMDAICEAKTVSRQTAEMYESGLIPYHLTQILTYCLVCAPLMTGEPQAYIFYLQDGRDFRGYHVPMIESICDQIVTRSEDFWNRVIKGREIMATVKDIDMRLKYLAEIEPEPDNTDAYSQFMSELWKMKQNFVRIEGTDEDLAVAKRYLELKSTIDTLDEERQGCRNRIIKTLHNNGANVIDFAGAGRITYNKKLYVNIKKAS
jgi:predicted phage-related endonuclease